MFTSMLSALAINSSDIPLKEYQEIIKNQPTYKIKNNRDEYINLSINNKIKINSTLSNLIDFYRELSSINKKIFINNFDRWEIEEAENILYSINYTINENKKLNKKYLKLKKLIKGHPSLTSKIDELIQLNNDIIEFSSQYLTRAKEADEASKFINDFISDNQEVLNALA